MSKRNKNKHFSSSEESHSIGFSEEYAVIKHDLLRVVILNAIYLAGVLTVYYTNLEQHYLERWFNQVFHF